jgi:hypothetical protein
MAHGNRAVIEGSLIVRSDLFHDVILNDTFSRERVIVKLQDGPAEDNMLSLGLVT